ncbi:hypothetical protein ACFLUM_00295, partial [Chloroflexota bacterium]
MLNSAPVPLQAILWPLLGAVTILIVGRFAPNWLRRLVALLAVAGSLSALWSLRTAGATQVEFFWEPLNFFRLSPTLFPDSLTLLAGFGLCIVTAATVLGIVGSRPQKTLWHGLVLITLSGSLIVAMGTNLITLALGSALIDLTLIAMAVSVEEEGRVAWRTVLPGILSTLLLFAAALRMDTQVGTASLLARGLLDEVAVVIGVAGLLRLMVLVLLPGATRTPEHAAVLILPTVAGLYLLARVQVLIPVLVDQSWVLVAGGAMLVIGGFVAWVAVLPVDRRRHTSGTLDGLPASPVSLASQEDQPDTGRAAVAVQAAALPQREQPSRVNGEPSPDAELKDARAGAVDELCRDAWPGLSAHQVGLALGFVVLLGGLVPWPLLGLPFALGTLVIWWDASLEREGGPRPRWLDWFVRQLASPEDRPQTAPDAQVTSRRWLLGTGWIRAVSVLPLAIVLGSLIGVPFTIGAAVRWTFYAALMDMGRAPLLLATLVGDLLLVAALYVHLRKAIRQRKVHRLRLPALVGMFALAALVIILGISPGVVTDSWGFQTSESPNASVWGLGLVYVLPWLLGIWLARSGSE